MMFESYDKSSIVNLSNCNEVMITKGVWKYEVRAYYPCLEIFAYRSDESTFSEQVYTCLFQGDKPECEVYLEWLKTQLGVVRYPGAGELTNEELVWQGRTKVPNV